MAKIITNVLTFKKRFADTYDRAFYTDTDFHQPRFISQEAKLLAITIFLIFFIDEGTLGLLPRQMYFLYRNVRVSDVLMYGLIIYSFFQAKEYYKLFTSRSLLIIKILLVYLSIQFIGSVIYYEVDPVEYFFRLKGVWKSFMIFPFLLLLKRGGFIYLIKLIFPFSVLSNIFYILSSLTGIAFLPDIGIVKQQLPGGLQVYRVYGGTFFGEYFFLGYIFYWITKRFRAYQLFFAILFIIPHILAFGRSAWLYFLFTIFMMFVWNSFKKKDLRTVVKQAFLILVLIVAVAFIFVNYIPGSENITEALEMRVLQGQEDVKYSEGTWGTRVENARALVELWLNTNILWGIGMHPLWVIKTVTVEEMIYYFGFSDIRWASVVAAYGLIGFLIAVSFQIYYFIVNIKIIRRVKKEDIYTFLILLFLIQLIFDSIINYTYYLFSVSLWGLSSMICIYCAITTYKFEELEL